MNSELNYFSQEELLILKNALKKSLRKVLAYEWINDWSGSSNRFIDKLEFIFDDFSKLILSCHDQEKRIQIYSMYDSEGHNEDLKKQFGEKIRMNTIDAGEFELWKNTIGKKLNAFDFQSDSHGVIAEKLILIFEEEKRIVELGLEDGLSFDFFEEESE